MKTFGLLLLVGAAAGLAPALALCAHKGLSDPSGAPSQCVQQAGNGLTAIPGASALAGFEIFDFKRHSLCGTKEAVTT